MSGCLHAARAIVILLTVVLTMNAQRQTFQLNEGGLSFKKQAVDLV